MAPDWAVSVFLSCSLFYLTNPYIHIDCAYSHYQHHQKGSSNSRNGSSHSGSSGGSRCNTSRALLGVFFYKLLFSYVINLYLLNRYYTMTDTTTKVATTTKMGPNSAISIVWAIVVGEYFFFLLCFLILTNIFLYL